MHSALSDFMVSMDNISLFACIKVIWREQQRASSYEEHENHWRRNHVHREQLLNVDSSFQFGIRLEGTGNETY